MMSRWKSNRELPLLMIVEGDLSTRRRISETLQKQDYRIAVARNVREGLEMIDDLKFSGSNVNGLLAEHRLSDGRGWRVVDGFRLAFPGAPAALFSQDDHIVATVWSDVRGVLLLRKPVDTFQLNTWLGKIRQPA